MKEGKKARERETGVRNRERSEEVCVFV